MSLIAFLLIPVICDICVFSASTFPWLSSRCLSRSQSVYHLLLTYTHTHKYTTWKIPCHNASPWGFSSLSSTSLLAPILIHSFRLGRGIKYSYFLLLSYHHQTFVSSMDEEQGPVFLWFTLKSTPSQWIPIYSSSCNWEIIIAIVTHTLASI